jgi:hypothetical protein
MKRDGNIAKGERLTEVVALDPRLQPEPPPQQPDARARRMIPLRAAPGVVAVRMGDQRPLDRAPRIDVEAAQGAVQAILGQRDEVGQEQRSPVGGLREVCRDRLNSTEDATPVARMAVAGSSVAPSRRASCDGSERAP